MSFPNHQVVNLTGSYVGNKALALISSSPSGPRPRSSSKPKPVNVQLNGYIPNIKIRDRF